MSSPGAQQVLFRTGIGAANSTSHLRVYFQDTTGSIREALYESGWANGTAQNVIAKGKLGTPISATSKELNNIRVYYISEGNTLKEACYDSGAGWYDGALSGMNFQVAPYSSVTGVFLAGTTNLILRVYAQSSDNTIQEFCWNSDGAGWVKGTNLGAALPGSGLAATSFKTSQLGIRVYMQDNNLNLIEKCYDANRGWYTGAFSVPKAAPRAGLSVTSWGSVSIRVYYAAANDKLLEHCWDGNGWYTGAFSQPCIPGTQSAVINWGNIELRVYFQKGNLVSGITEWMWSGGWSVGNNAIPPA